MIIQPYIQLKTQDFLICLYSGKKFRNTQRRSGGFGSNWEMVGLFLIISILEITTKQVITPFVKKNLDFWK